MLEEVGKNLWLLLTIVIPGFCTYGAWRLLLVLSPGSNRLTAALTSIDDKTWVTASIIVAVALLQQAVSIISEAALTGLAKLMGPRWPNFHALFRERFDLAASGELTENATRIVGNYFQSTNICVGLGFLLLYFLLYEKTGTRHWIPVGLALLLVAGLVTTAYRLYNAMWAVAECKKKLRTTQEE
jgi:hypothetical protein